ncbi:MAG: hypothetical protein HY317_03715 [Acidobacteria bacterium]|nr:hypothetical protein [Acidobacteriota bacterium]
MPPIDFRSAPLLLQAGVLVQLGLLCACFLGIVGLRLLRRGAARFWMAPGVTALVLAPVALASGMTVALFRQTLGGMALTGSGGIAALAAGSAEALIPLLFGLGSVAALAFVGLLVTAIGSSRGEDAGSRGGMALQGASLAAVALSAGLVVLSSGMVYAVNAGLRDPEAILTRWRVSLVGSVGLALLLLALVLAATLGAPRGVSRPGARLVSLSALSLSGIGALAGLWLV